MVHSKSAAVAEYAVLAVSVVSVARSQNAAGFWGEMRLAPLNYSMH